jgi:hemolysin activation/secretion protein
MNRPHCLISTLCLSAGLLASALSYAEQAILPPLDLPKERISALPSLFLKEVRLEGNQVIASELLQARIAGYQGRVISAEELQEIRHILSEYYREQGYINSGALIPDQEVKDGVVLIKIIEGRLTDIEVSGNEYLRTPYIERRVRSAEETVLNTKDLQERLQILQQNPLIKRFNAQLGPGLRLGEARLDLEIIEERPYQFGLNFNNHRSPSVGAYRAELWGRHRNLSGWGDTLSARYGLTEGLKDYTLDYSIPLNARDTVLALHAERSDSEVVAEPFNQIDIESQSDTYSIALRHPFYQVYTEDFHYKLLEAGISLEKRASETWLLGRPFSFSPGVQDGKSKLTVARLTQNWLDRSRTRVIAAYSSFNIGLDALDATLNDGLDEQGNPAIEPDGEFFSWIGQFRWIERLPDAWDSQLWFRADLQWANDDLLPLEKFAIGGAATVRGYRENQLTRDSGLVLSLEWRVPIATLKIPKLSTREGDGTLFLAPFMDYGRGWNHGLETPTPKYLLSAGLGLLWTPSEHLRAELYWGHALKDAPAQQDRDLQDDGIHFAVEMSF